MIYPKTCDNCALRRGCSIFKPLRDKRDRNITLRNTNLIPFEISASRAEAMYHEAELLASDCNLWFENIMPSFHSWLMTELNDYSWLPQVPIAKRNH